MENRIPCLKTKIKKEIKNYLHEVDKNLTIIADIVKEDNIFQNIIIYDSQYERVYNIQGEIEFSIEDDESIVKIDESKNIHLEGKITTCFNIESNNIYKISTVRYTISNLKIYKTTYKNIEIIYYFKADNVKVKY